jgi:CubicO group peptidase (beta-lactamase class C family)
MIKSFTLLLLLTATCFPEGVIGADDPFVSASSVEEERDKISNLPDDDVWTTVTGKDMAWLHKNVYRVFPTVNLYREGQVRELDYELNPVIARHPVATPAGSMGFMEFLDSDQSATMGMVILHKGKIVFEHYPRQQAYEKPIFWSVTKVLVATMVGLLEDQGLVDIGKPIDTYLPELADSSFAGILIRNILDMATGLDCPEDYSDRNSCYYLYSKTIGEGHWGESDPDNPYTYVAGLKVGKFAEQGTSFSYTGVNTFVLGWLVEKITGMPFQDAFTRDVWSQIGAESDAALLAPRFGVPNMSGGLMARMRDLARFGLLYTPSYLKVTDKRIVSERLINLIQNGGNPALLEHARGGPARADGVKHNAYQWDLIFDNGDFYKGGWGGQGLLVNPDLDLVAVYSGYTRDDHSEIDPLPHLRLVLQGVYGPETRATP